MHSGALEEDTSSLKTPTKIMATTLKIEEAKLTITGTLSFRVQHETQTQFELKIETTTGEINYHPFTTRPNGLGLCGYNLKNYYPLLTIGKELKEMWIRIVDPKIPTEENSWVTVTIESPANQPEPSQFKKAWLRFKNWLRELSWKKLIIRGGITAIIIGLGMLILSIGIPKFKEWKKNRGAQVAENKKAAAEEAANKKLPPLPPVPGASTNKESSAKNFLPPAPKLATAHVTITGDTNSGSITITGDPDAKNNITAPLYNSGSSNIFHIQNQIIYNLGGSSSNGPASKEVKLPPVPTAKAGKVFPDDTIPLKPSSDPCTIKGCIIPPGKTYAFTYPIRWKASMFTHTQQWDYKWLKEGRVIEHGSDISTGYLMYQNNSGQDMVVNFVLEFKYPEVAQKASW